MAAKSEKPPRYVQAFAKALGEVTPIPIVIPGLDEAVVGRPDGTSYRALKTEEEFPEIRRCHRYTFERLDRPLRVWIDFYKNTRQHWRLFAFCREGMLFSLNLTCAHRDGTSVELSQQLKFADRRRSPRRKRKAMADVCAKLEELGFEVSDERDIRFPCFDASTGRFGKISVEKFIERFITVAVIKGHYMENKRYELPLG